MNLNPSDELVKQLTTLYSPDPSITLAVEQVVIEFGQAGGVDCGLFAIAYATEIAFGQNPASFIYDQSKMRSHLLTCLGMKQMLPFPKMTSLTSTIRHKDVTSNIPVTDKWSQPVKACNLSSVSNDTILDTTNRFSPLTDLSSDITPNTHFQGNRKVSANDSNTICPPTEAPLTHGTNNKGISTNALDSPTSQAAIDKSTCLNNSTGATTRENDPSTTSRPIKSKTRASISRAAKPIKKDSIVINISNRSLSEVEKSVLELGLSFSPSQKLCDKEKLGYDFYQFIRKLKLREFFSEEDTNIQQDIDHTDSVTTPENDRSDMKWTEKHPDWYPEEVQNNRSEGLTKWIKDITEEFNSNLKLGENKFWNNLSDKQRKALETLSKDDSIVIKSADKGGAIVIMNSEDYEKGCLEQLQNLEYYEEVTGDPTATYRERVNDLVRNLKSKGLVTPLEEKTLKRGSRIPKFYGLPKIHKFFELFPSLRGICSGSDGPTAKLSEFVDSFLKPIARTTLSYIEDSKDFINKTISLRVVMEKLPFLVTMDVVKLYPNIDQEEGADACEYFLNLRKIVSIPTTMVKSMILLILRSNTMCFNNKFYHQKKGTAIGTAMAVNFANLFMSKFESEMLESYELQYGKRPTFWLRYIDDIFFIWYYDEQSLKHFLDFCNNYSTQSSMSSNIKFTSHYSRESVVFLDMKVYIEDGRILTDLFSKPTATHTYLHASSFHPRSTILSLPKTQFIRLRRICSTDKNYWIHAHDFISFFSKRGYKAQNLHKIVVEVSILTRESLLQKKAPKVPNDHPDSVIFTTTWHPNLKFLQNTLRSQYNKIIKLYPNLQKVFPTHPMVAYKKNKSLKEIITKARYGRIPNISTPLIKPNKSHIEKNMSKAKEIVNIKSGKKARISGGSATDKNVIYAAICKCDNLMYIGQTKTPLNERFNRHRSDILHYPYRCELDKHFHLSKNCRFEDLEIFILEKDVTGSRHFREIQEDKWILRLDSLKPNGINAHLSSFGNTMKQLFD